MLFRSGDGTHRGSEDGGNEETRYACGHLAHHEEGEDGIAFSVDFIQRFRPNIKDAALLRVARWTCIVSGLIGLGIALLMATWDITSLLDYFNTILGLLTSGLGGLFVMAVFIPRIKGWSALTGFIAGEVVVLLMYLYTDANFFLFGATGIVVSVITAWLLSTCKRGRKH